MEERENFSFMEKGTEVRYHKKLKKSKINPVIFIYILIIIIFFLLLVIIGILLYKNKKLSQSLNKGEKNTIINNIKNNLNSKPFEGKRLFHYKNDEFVNTTKNIIHISYSLDNKLTYPTLVSMTSGLENNNFEANLIVYHLLFSGDYNTSNIDIFESLKENYEVKINYYIIPPIFNSSRRWTDGTDCVYYKVILPLMFPDLERIIYLDGDTLIRKDIWEMYNYPFNGSYILGHPFYTPEAVDRFKINATHYINGGCLLFNIEKIRKDKKDVDLLQFTIKRNNNLRFREQDSINYVFHPKIGFLPLKYGMYMIPNNYFFKIIATKYVRSHLNLTEGYEAIVDPAVVHFSCCWPKIWNNATKNLFKHNETCYRYQKEFYYYANKTKYYSLIHSLLY